MKKSIPTDAQARILAIAWGKHKIIGPGVGGRSAETPTVRTCIKHGWLKMVEGTDRQCLNPLYRQADWSITISGLDAIEDYLRDRRFKRPSP